MLNIDRPGLQVSTSRAIRGKRCLREACQMRFQTPQANSLGVHKNLLQMNQVAMVKENTELLSILQYLPSFDILCF